MKGVVLAGGTGTRLRPMTRVTNKHVLPVYDEPMIFYPVRTLLDAGISDILVISGPEYIGRYIELLDGEFDANFTYKVQSEALGIAHGLKLAEGFVDDKVVLILGDNVLLGDVSESLERFESAETGAKVFITEVDRPSAYGIARIDDDQVTALREKPDNPQSDKAVLGLYAYDSDVFDKIDEIEPSDRGEYEITDVNKQYVEEGTLQYEIFDGDWFDAGTPEGLFQAAKYVRERDES